MSTIRAYLLIMGGTVAAYGGLLQALSSIGTAEAVLVWGIVTIVGLFILFLGVERLFVDHDDDAQPNPDGALTKTDPRVRRR